MGRSLTTPPSIKTVHDPARAPPTKVIGTATPTGIASVLHCSDCDECQGHFPPGGPIDPMPPMTLEVPLAAQVLKGHKVVQASSRSARLRARLSRLWDIKNSCGPPGNWFLRTPGTQPPKAQNRNMGSHPSSGLRTLSLRTSSTLEPGIQISPRLLGNKEVHQALARNKKLSVMDTVSQLIQRQISEFNPEVKGKNLTPQSTSTGYSCQRSRFHPGSRTKWMGT